MAERAKPNRLTHEESFNVMTWLSTQRDTFTKEPTTYTEINEQVKEKTGVTLSISTLKAMLISLKIRPTFKGIGGQSKSEGLQNQINTLLEMVRETDAKLKSVADDMKCGFIKNPDGSYSLLHFKGANK